MLSQAFSDDSRISLPIATVQVILTPLAYWANHNNLGGVVLSMAYIILRPSPSCIGVARECKSGAPKASISSSDPITQGHKQAGRRTGGMSVQPLGRL